MKKIQRYDQMHSREFSFMMTAHNGQWVSYQDYINVVEACGAWIPIDKIKLELWGVYWLKVDGEVLRNPAGWMGETFNGGLLPINKTLVTHVIKLTTPKG